MPRWDGTSDPPPCERRCDGDRIIELVPAAEWLADDTKNMLLRNSDNADMLPGRQFLPRTAYRDHLHDNARATSVFDNANPGITTYVRVSRRLAKEGAMGDQAREDQLLQIRAEIREQTRLKELREAQEAREVLELRSLGIRTAMRKCEWPSRHHPSLPARAACPCCGWLITMLCVAPVRRQGPGGHGPGWWQGTLARWRVEEVGPVCVLHVGSCMRRAREVCANAAHGRGGGARALDAAASNLADVLRAGGHRGRGSMAQTSKHRGSTGTALTGCKAVVADTHDGTVCVAHRESVLRPS
jgi:hypothetical protein